jgi:erythronate-4-phosphate dehydrogenase
VLHAYPIRKDDKRFRADPASFEFQRENYPVRREYPAYRVHYRNVIPGSMEILRELGFQLIKAT